MLAFMVQLFLIAASLSGFAVGVGHLIAWWRTRKFLKEDD